MDIICTLDQLDLQWFSTIFDKLYPKMLLTHRQIPDFAHTTGNDTLIIYKTREFMPNTSLDLETTDLALGKMGELFRNNIKVGYVIQTPVKCIEWGTNWVAASKPRFNPLEVTKYTNYVIKEYMNSDLMIMSYEDQAMLVIGIDEDHKWRSTHVSKTERDKKAKARENKF